MSSDTMSLNVLRAKEHGILSKVLGFFPSNYCQDDAQSKHIGKSLQVLQLTQKVDSSMHLYRWGLIRKNFKENQLSFSNFLG